MKVISPGEGTALPRFRLTYRRPLAEVAIRWAALSMVCAAGFFLSGARGTFRPVYIILFGAFRIAMVALHRREQRHRSELMAQQMGQNWECIGPLGPFRSGRTVRSGGTLPSRRFVIHGIGTRAATVARRCRHHVGHPCWSRRCKMT